jgi:hypothetical protein
LKYTTALEVKFVPKTVSVNCPEPAVTQYGLMELMVGGAHATAYRLDVPFKSLPQRYILRGSALWAALSKVIARSRYRFVTGCHGGPVFGFCSPPVPSVPVEARD